MTTSPFELRLLKERLEAELQELRSRLNQQDERVAALRVNRHTRADDQLLDQYRTQGFELRREIQRRKIALAEVSEGLARAAVEERYDLVGQLEQQNEAAMQELDMLRREVRNALLGMADLLRRHQRLAEEKVSIVRELSRLTDRDYAYENYISCSLLHQADYQGDVQFVVDLIKKMRPVS